MNSYFALKKKWLMDAIANTVILLFALNLNITKDYELSTSVITTYTTPISINLKYSNNEDSIVTADVLNIACIEPELIEMNRYYIDDVDVYTLAVNEVLIEDVIYGSVDLESIQLNLLSTIPIYTNAIIYNGDYNINNELMIVNVNEMYLYDLVYSKSIYDDAQLELTYCIDTCIQVNNLNYLIDVFSDIDCCIAMMFNANLEYSRYNVYDSLNVTMIDTILESGLDAKINSRYTITVDLEVEGNVSIEMSMYLDISRNINGEVNADISTTENLSAILLYNINEDFINSIDIITNIETLSIPVTYYQDVEIDVTLEVSRIRVFSDLTGLEFTDLFGLKFRNLYTI